MDKQRVVVTASAVTKIESQIDKDEFIDALYQPCNIEGFGIKHRRRAIVRLILEAAARASFHADPLVFFLRDGTDPSVR